MAPFRALRFLAVMCLASALAACSGVDVVPDGSYSREFVSGQAPIGAWSLEGRLALSGGKDSWSANLSWAHGPAEDRLKLSGPLGQGATVVRLSGTQVSIDRGGGDVQVSDQPEDFVSQQLGMSVPITALRYWLVGLPEPGQAFVDMGSGFRQSDWLIEYKQMQPVGERVLPRKMTVMNSQVKLKLIIEQWVVNGAN